jgi:hypothetical protein
LFSEAAALTTKEGAPTLFLFPLFPTMMDDDDALLPLTETMLFRKEREKTDDDVMLLL